jgi:signal transduction histidine kinase
MVGAKNQNKSTNIRQLVVPDGLSTTFTALLNSNSLAVAVSDASFNILATNAKFKREVIGDIFRESQWQFKRAIKKFTREFSETTTFSIGGGTGIEGMHMNHNGRSLFLWIATKEQSGASAINAIPSAETFEYVVHTGADHRVTYCNELFSSDFGYASPASAVGLLLTDIFQTDRDFWGLVNQLSRGARIKRFRTQLKTGNGKKLSALINCCGVKCDDAEMIYWTILDISPGVVFEENLKSKHKELERVNGIVEKFLYSTSHDLRSPVSSILGLVNLIRLEERKDFTFEYVNKIEESAIRLDTIIKNLLGYSKTSYQRSRVELMDLKALVPQIIQRYRDERNFPSIFFDLNIITDSPFFSDRERIELIVDNLVRNAIHFTDRNKLKSIIRIQIIVSRDQASMEFLDNGQGIGKEHLGHIFNMFYKASDVSKGAGLGLYIVKESVHQLDGSVVVESELGFGSLFKLQIPNRKLDDGGQSIDFAA